AEGRPHGGSVDQWDGNVHRGTIEPVRGYIDNARCTAHSVGRDAVQLHGHPIEDDGVLPHDSDLSEVRVQPGSEVRVRVCEVILVSLGRRRRKVEVMGLIRLRFQLAANAAPVLRDRGVREMYY